MKILQKEMPFRNPDEKVWKRGLWPASWITFPNYNPEESVFLHFQLKLTRESSADVTFHVSADEQYRLYLNGNFIGSGPENGTLEHWFFESWNTTVPSGENVLDAYVSYASPELRRHSKIATAPAFLLATEKDTASFSTGLAPWRVGKQTQFRRIPAKICWGQASFLEIDGRKPSEIPLVPASIQAPAADSALYRMTDRNNRNPVPAMCPEQHRERILHAVVRQGENFNVEKLLRGESSLTIPPNSTREYLIDLEDYACFENGVTLSGGTGSKVELAWAESLFSAPERTSRKGNRDEVAGKFFRGEGDRFLSGGGKMIEFHSYEWHSGRYLKLSVQTEKEPLEINRLTLISTGYPLSPKFHITTSDSQLKQLIPILFHTLRMCAHETFMDCPYYEQMQYAGDARMECLVLYRTCPDDDRLARKAILLLNDSRDSRGTISSRFPAKQLQFIPGFDLYWIAMVYDFAHFRKDVNFIKPLLPAIRTSLHFFLANVTPENLLTEPDGGWYFYDWCQGWTNGEPPVGKERSS